MTFTEHETSLAYQMLGHVGYYRLAGYAKHFERPPGAGIPSHTYRAGTTFSQVVNLYCFDQDLRNLCTEALQRIEVSLRTMVCNKLSIVHSSPFWYAVANVFVPPQADDLLAGTDVLSKIYRAFEFDASTGVPYATRKLGRYTQLDTFYDNYSGPPPGWILREIGSFGLWSRIFNELDDASIRQSIAGEFKFPCRKKSIDEQLLRGWIHTLSVFRNACAHHQQLVNRAPKFPPSTPANPNWAPIVPPVPTLRPVLGVIALVDKNTMANSPWVAQLHGLLEKYEPVIDLYAAAGFATDWANDPLWSI